MRIDIKKLYDDSKKWIEDKWGSFIKNRDTINTISTIALIIVSVLLIIVTAKSYTISKDISDIQVYLAVEREKHDTLIEITLAEDLLQEVKWNKDELLLIISTLDDMKENNQARPDYIRTEKIQRSIEMVGFGSKDMRNKFENYLTIMDLVKDDLKEIQSHSKARDNIKVERINHTLKFSKSIVDSKFENVNIDEFIKNIEDYILERIEHYSNLDIKLENLIPSS